MPAVAMTDHGNMFGAVEFYNTAKKHGIKPILGCEVYVAPENRHEKKSKDSLKVDGEIDVFRPAKGSAKVIVGNGVTIKGEISKADEIQLLFI